MKIYLSKSNRSNPNHLIQVRHEIKELYPDAEIVEHLGGSYSSSKLLGSDYAFMVSDSDPEPEDDTDRMIVSVGRGLYSESELMVQKGREQGRHLAYYCYFRDNGDFTLHAITNTRIKNMDNYIRYGHIRAKMEVTPFAEII